MKSEITIFEIYDGAEKLKKTITTILENGQGVNFKLLIRNLMSKLLIRMFCWRTKVVL